MSFLDIARGRASAAVGRVAGRGSARRAWRRRAEGAKQRGVAAALGAAMLAAAGMVTVGAAPAAAQASPGNEVLSWGGGGDQLGDGTNISRDTPGSVLLPGGATFTKVAAGRVSAHSLALTSSGLVYAWGRNDSGQLGDGTNTNRDRPVQVEGLPGDTTVVDIAASTNASLALTADQRLYAWGSGGAGQLGNGDGTDDSNTPVQVTATWPADTTFTAIEAGLAYGMALTSTGDLYVWGSNSQGQLGDGTNSNRTVPQLVTTLPEDTTVTGIAAGGQFSLAVLSTGQVYAWGDNSNGAVGSGCPGTSCTTPVEVPLPGSPTVEAVAAGAFHSFALAADGTVLAWGRNNEGELGDGTNDGGGTPRPVSLPGGTTVTEVIGGSLHSVAITATGEALAWGLNGAGQLGDGTTTDSNVPVSVLMPAGAQVRGVAAGAAFSLAVVSTGPAVDWGANTNGQLGNNSRVDSLVPVAPDLSEGVSVVDISGGFQHSLAATQGGHVYAWGSNGTGQLGDPGYTTGYSDHPIEADVSDVVQVAGGELHSLALTSDGDVYAWGANGLGQLGLGQPSAPVRQPTPVVQSWPDDVEAVAIAAGDHHSLVLLSNGTVFAWGDNSVGELGNGSSSADSPVPVIVEGLAGLTITGIGTGTGHGVAVADTGQVYAWGANSLGQLGSGATGGPQTTAQLVTGLDGVTITEVATGYSHTLALDATGQLHAWGLNNHGQLGNNDAGPGGQPTPVVVDQSNLGGASVVSIAGGNQHSLAVDATGKPYGWGFNDRGQVGDGTQTERSRPVAVTLTGALAGTAVSQVAGGQSHSLAR